MQKTPVSCSKDCTGGCPLLAQVEDGVIQKIGNNPLGAYYMTGCINGFQMFRTVHHPDRLKKPLIRSAERGSGEFKEASWDAALDYTAEKLMQVKQKYGPLSILNLAGTGTIACSLNSSYLLPARFLSLFGGYTGFTGSYSAGASGFAVPYVLGKTGFGIDPLTLKHSELFLLWGSNLTDTHEGCGISALILEAKKAGKEVIVVDPRRTHTVQTLATQWIPCRPGTDTALMLAVLFVLLEEKLVDEEFIRHYSVGFEELRAYVLGKQGGPACTPEWAEKICGTPAEKIRSLARQYGKAKPAALITGLSIQRSFGGEESHRMTIILQTVTGNLGRLGGTAGTSVSRLSKPAVGSLPVSEPPFQETIPILRWPDAILEGKAGGYPADIKAVYTVASNYVVQGSDVNKNIRAFKALDFAVCHDIFLTHTARYCDVVFPATTYLERNDIVVPNTGNYLLFSNKAVEPQGEARNDYDIFCGLADRLGFGQEFSEGRDQEAWLQHFLEESDVPDPEAFRREGIYFAPDQMRAGLSDFIADPAANPLDTPSGKVEISSQAYARETGFSAFPLYRPIIGEDGYPLTLITPKSKYRIHSQGSNVEWIRAREQQTLWMHPLDAAERGISDAEKVLVYNPRGKMRIDVLVTDEIMPGVVCLYEGIWPEFDEEGVDTAGSANVLSSTQGTLPSKGSTTHTIFVQVEAVVDSRSKQKTPE